MRNRVRHQIRPTDGIHFKIIGRRNRNKLEEIMSERERERGGGVILYAMGDTFKKNRTKF